MERQLVNVDGVPIEDAETHRHSRFAGTIAVAAGSAPLGPAIPLPKVPLPAPLLATGSGSMAVATTFEVSARLGTVGTLGAINQAGLGARRSRWRRGTPEGMLQVLLTRILSQHSAKTSGRRSRPNSTNFARNIPKCAMQRVVELRMPSQSLSSE